MDINVNGLVVEAILGGSESDYPNLYLRDHPTTNGKSRHLKFEHRYMFFHGRQQSRACATERYPTQFGKTVLSKSLCIKVSVASNEDTLCLERSHTDHRIGRIVWYMVSKKEYTMASTPQISANRIRHVLIKE